MMEWKRKRFACLLLFLLMANTAPSAEAAAASAARGVKDRIVRSLVRFGMTAPGRAVHKAGKMAVRAAAKEAPKAPLKESSWIKHFGVGSMGFLAGAYSAKQNEEAFSETLSRAGDNVPVLGDIYRGFRFSSQVFSVGLPLLLILIFGRSAVLIWSITAGKKRENAVAGGKNAYPR